MVSVQLDRFDLLQEALASDCDNIRFGPEFCEVKIPTTQALKEAYGLTREASKSFTYVSPRVSNSSIERIREHISYLAGESAAIVVNDLGSLRIALGFPSLHIHWGRQLAYVPARCPWNESPIGTGLLEKRRLKLIMSESSLDQPFMTDNLLAMRVRDLEIDCLTESMRSAKDLVKNGFTLHAHLDGIPVTVTRKCHTARFFGEHDPEHCSKPCDSKAIMLKEETVGVTLTLYGNVVYRHTHVDRETIASLRKSGVTEYIVAMNSMTGFMNGAAVNRFMADLGLKT